MRRFFWNLPAVLLFAATAMISAAEIKTIGGTGEDRWFGDGGLATEAGMGQPFGLVIGPDGALYVCETTGHSIRRIDLKTNRISTIVGTGKKGNSGDGGPATQAEVDEPYELRFDRDGHLFFVDRLAAVVRRVDAKTGVITTIAGTGKPGFSGDGGPATKAQLLQPHSIVLDNAGSLYICDIGNHRVRRVDLKTGIISTFAGTGGRQPTPDGAPLEGTPLNGPRALDFDGQHTLYLALREGNAIYRIDLKDKTLHHLAGTGKSGNTGNGGPAKLATLSGPKGVAIGTDGDIYFADTESHTIRVVRLKSGTVEVVAGTGKKGDGPDGDPFKCGMNRPHGVYVAADGKIYIGDSSCNRVRVFIP